jgi:hypothetical protein
LLLLLPLLVLQAPSAQDFEELLPWWVLLLPAVLLLLPAVVPLLAGLLAVLAGCVLSTAGASGSPSWMNTTLCTSGLPTVSVPVLSNTTTCVLQVQQVGHGVCMNLREHHFGAACSLSLRITWREVTYARGTGFILKGGGKQEQDPETKTMEHATFSQCSTLMYRITTAYTPPRPAFTTLRQDFTVRVHPYLCARSSVDPPLMRTPSFAATPVATMTTVGVAKPSAHGHAITRTDTAAAATTAGNL